LVHGQNYEDRTGSNRRVGIQDYDLDFGTNSEEMARRKLHKLEEQLADVIAGLIKASAVEKEWKRQRDEEERRRAELKAQRAEQERLRRIDGTRWRHLNELREAAQRASLVREFIDRLEHAVRVKREARRRRRNCRIGSGGPRAKNASDPLLKSPEALIKHNLTITERATRIDAVRINRQTKF
jgi:hypothetical protein